MAKKTTITGEAGASGGSQFLTVESDQEEAILNLAEMTKQEHEST